ncbi:MAG: hypothetical protein MHPSP_000172 [Paramarteilia canceri]
MPTGVPTRSELLDLFYSERYQDIIARSIDPSADSSKYYQIILLRTYCLTKLESRAREQLVKIESNEDFYFLKLFVDYNFSSNPSEYFKSTDIGSNPKQYLLENQNLSDQARFVASTIFIKENDLVSAYNYVRLSSDPECEAIEKLENLYSNMVLTKLSKIIYDMKFKNSLDSYNSYYENEGEDNKAPISFKMAANKLKGDFAANKKLVLSHSDEIISSPAGARNAYRILVQEFKPNPELLERIRTKANFQII